jgi:nitrite reductase/ring-hydroxylating ferredoxin subunit
MLHRIAMRLTPRLYEIYRATMAGGNAEKIAPMPRLVKLAALDDLPPGASLEIECDGRVIALFNRGGVIHAVDGICPHQGGPLAEGECQGTFVTCPWHGWQIDLATGRSPTQPRLVHPVYPVTIEGQDVLVEVPG